MNERDPAFWRAVYEHPEVKPHVGLGHDLDIEAIVSNQAITPCRYEHGGFLFLRLDALGRVFELHTLFTPEGWGREVATALKDATARMFASGASLITTQETEGHWRSRPPITHRWQAAGDFEPAPGLDVSLRTWVLTRAAWDASPARRRM